MTGYSIYTGTDQFGQVFQFDGFGLSGVGATGTTLGYGTKREGENKWEATGNQVDPTLGSDLLVYDFDSGLAANDALGALLGIHDLGLGAAEADQAEGDSGGPCFINGSIAALVEAGASYPPTDVDGTTDSSFGELAFDTNLATFVPWINAIVSSGSRSRNPVNQTTAGMQQWSSVALDASGDFVVTWTSYGQDGGGNGYGAGVNGENGVYARRFNSDGSAGGNEFKVNTFTANNQQHSQVAMDAAGDFVVTWESFQDRPAVGTGLPDVRKQLRHLCPALCPRLPDRRQFLPRTQRRDGHRVPPQHHHRRRPTLSIRGHGRHRRYDRRLERQTACGDPSDVFMQRYNNLTDTAGPFVTSVLNYYSTTGVPTLTQIYTGATIVDPISQFVITFDENLNTTYGPGGTHSITNLSNWTLTNNGTAMRNGVSIRAIRPEPGL